MTYTSGNARSLSNLLAANERVTAGRNMLNPEDDPTYYVTAYSMQIMSNEATQYSRNAENAITWLDNEDNLLQTAYDYLSKARNELAVAGRNDSQNAESRKALAGDVLSILNAMKDIGNSQYLGRYVFAGYETQTEPFVSGDREVSAVVSSYNGTEAVSRKLFSDMPELKEGSYTMNVSVQDGVAYLNMTDSLGKTVLLDSNGSDETTTTGNVTTTTLVAAYDGETVINTGVGLGIKLPDDIPNGTDIKMQFYYTPGDDITYLGDDGKITSKIASNQEVVINVSGQETFMETYRTTKGTTKNTVNGLSITNTTKFSQIDGANASLADSISFSGTDHNGYAIGTARVSSPGNVNLDMSNASEEERTITITYANRNYDITLSQKGYSGMDEILFEINRSIENQGLGGEMSAVSDGDRLMFISKRTGEGVQLSVTGSENNKLGFKDLPVTANGMDTTFEMYYDNYAGPVTTTHTNVAIAAAYTEVNVNGQTIGFTPASGSAADIETALNQALMDKGLGFTVYGSVVDSGTPGQYDITFNLMNTEFTDETYLATKIAGDYQFDTPRGTDYPIDSEKKISDMLSYIENLYGNAVDASLVDGRLQVKDLRSGTSKLAFSINENNSGIGYSENTSDIMLSGYYTSKKDDQWNVMVNVSATDITIQVTDKLGNTIFDNSANPISKANYSGGDIELGNGVKIKLGDIAASATPITASFEIELTANSNLSFGDLNITEKGENVNVFKSLENLYFALNMNIPDSGIGAPSSWSKENLNSTAVPSLDGEFRGNYNDIFNFEVQYSDTKSDFYLQKNQEWTSETFKDYNVGTVGFELVLDTDDGKVTRSFSSSAGTASAKLDDLIAQINADSSLQQLGVRAYNDEGKLRIDAHSGAIGIDVNYDDDLSSYVMGMSDSAPATAEIPPKLDLSNVDNPVTLNIDYYDGAAWQNTTVTINNVDYPDTATLLADITAQLPAGVTVSIGAGNLITFSGPTSDIIVSGDETGALGFYNKAGADTISNRTLVTMDLSEKNSLQRTLTFAYNDGSDKTASIVVDAENFMTYEDMIENINEKIAAAGLTGVVQAELVGENGIGFSFTGVTGTSVQGDYESTLGFAKAGDAVKIKVTGDDGELINVYSMDTAGEKYYVADGVYQYYDAGYLYATDSFTAAVGSGIEYELDVLAKAESQVLAALTTVGNSTSKAESAVTFNKSLKLTTEELKAKYTGSTTIDQTQALSELTVNETAYQYALKSTSLLLGTSLLDYL
jgi:flagellin-like hook-associated protein FlgL